jgi:hypothetical protein
MSKQYPGGIISKTAPTLNPALGGGASGIWTMDQVATAIKNNSWPPYDPYFKYNTLMLHGNGANAATNNTFLDSSTNNFTITRNGNTTQGTFSPYGTTWSNYFDGTSGQYLNAPANAAFSFGTGDFTVEGWVYPTTTSGTRPIVEIRTTGGATGFALLSQSGVSTLNVYTNSAFVGASTNSLTLNTWNHVALVRSGNTWTYWINGVSGGSFTNSSTQSDGATTGPKIGGSTTAGEVWIGYLSNIRVVKGTALYTTAFTPSTTPLTAISGTSLLTCQSNRFIDTSSNAFAITVNGSPSIQGFSPFSPPNAYAPAVIGGSGYFDGSGDYLQTPSNAAFGYGTGDFSLEFWAYPTVSSDNNRVVFHTDDNFNLELINSGGSLLQFYSGSARTSSPYTYTVNAWNHCAITRQSGTARMFINGKLVNNFAFTSSKGTSAVQIGANAGASQYLTGYLANVRIVNGGIPSAYVTSSTTNGTQIFTPPTAPFTTSDSLTGGSASLLLNYTNSGVLDNAMMNNLETAGSTQISTSVSKFGTSSIYFNGSSTMVYNGSNTAVLGTGDFTIEFWAYLPNAASSGNFLDMRPTSTNGAYPNIYYSSNALGVYIGGADRIVGGSVSSNTWYHIAFCRFSGTSKLFLNGTQVGSSYTDTNNYLCGSTRPMIGGNGYLNSANLTAYLYDYRITKGYARYPANFTAPTSQLQDQ